MMSVRDENLAALLAKLSDDSVAHRLVSLLRESDYNEWDEVLAGHVRHELAIEVERVTADAEAQLDRG